MTYPPSGGGYDAGPGGGYGSPSGGYGAPGAGYGPGGYGDTGGGYGGGAGGFGGPSGGGYGPQGGPAGAFLPDPGDPLIGLDIGTWFSRSVDALKRSWKGLLAIVGIQVGASILVMLLLGAVLFFLIGGAIAASKSQDPGSLFGGVLVVILPAALIAGLLMAVVGSWGQIASISLIAREATGRGGLSEAMADGSRRMWAMLGWTLVGGLVAAVGYILCFIPGLVVSAVIGALLAPVVLFEEGQSPFDRLINIPQRAGGGFWGRTLMMLVFGVVITGVTRVFSSVLQIPVQAVFGSDDSGTSLAVLLVVNLISVGISFGISLLWQVLTQCLTATNYMSSRYTESGGQVTTPVAAAVLP